MNQGSGGQPSQTPVFVWIILGVIGASVLTWLLAKVYVVEGFFYLRHYEILVMYDVVSMLDKVLSWVHLPTINTQDLRYWDLYMAATPPKEASFNDLLQLSTAVGRWEYYPVVAVLLGYASVLFFRQGARRYRHVYNMKDFKKDENANWPQITPVVDIDLVSQPIDKGKWAIAKVPLDYAREHDLICASMKGRHPIWRLKKGPAYRLMVMQLGPQWRGVNALPIHIKALVVIFVARMSREPDIAKHLLCQIGASASGGKLDFKGVEAQLKKYQNHKAITWLEQRHVYVNTLLATMLELSRANGVLSTAEFLWLKPVDRRLWYVLNSVGRQTVVIEVAGVFAHWLTERKMGRGLKVPMVKEAVVAFESSLEEVLRVEKGEVWHSSAA